MTVARIEIDDRELIEAFNRLLALGEDPAPALNAVGRVLKARIQEGFRASVSPYGVPWAPLKSRAGQPLLDSGQLMNSIDYRIEGDAVEVGTNKPYAPVHQFGATIEAAPGRALRFMVNGKPVFVKRVTIPARPMFPLDGLPDPWVADALEAIGDVVRRRWNPGGGAPA